MFGNGLQLEIIMFILTNLCIDDVTSMFLILKIYLRLLFIMFSNMLFIFLFLYKFESIIILDQVQHEWHDRQIMKWNTRLSKGYIFDSCVCVFYKKNKKIYLCSPISWIFVKILIFLYFFCFSKIIIRPLFIPVIY